MQKSPHSKLVTKLAVNLSHLLNVTEDEYEKNYALFAELVLIRCSKTV